jgi:histidinol-phosphatase (PHP family)
MEEQIQKAISIGLQEIAFTDHVDYDYPDQKFPFMIDYDKYLITFSNLKNKYKQDIDIVLGIEIGFQSHVVNKINNLLSNYPFDFIICSTHVADRLDLYNGDFFKGKEQKNAYLRYFEVVLDCVKAYQNYDVFGHLDYIVRYGNYPCKQLSYYDYKDIVDSILKTLIENGHGIEINTSGYRYKLNQTHPQLDILKRYKELGGEIITIGSDAHKTQDLCSHFDTAYDMLKSVGFDSIATFRQRKPRFINI